MTLWGGSPSSAERVDIAKDACEENEGRKTGRGIEVMSSGCGGELGSAARQGSVRCNGRVYGCEGVGPLSLVHSVKSLSIAESWFSSLQYKRMYTMYLLMMMKYM